MALKPMSVLNFDLNEASDISKLSKDEKQQLFQEISEKEIFNSMVSNQSKNRWYNANVLFKKERIKILFGVIQKTSEILELNINTYCLTIHLFDALAAKFPLEKDEMLPISLVCMQIASKVSENQGKIVNYKDLNEYVYNYGVDFFLQIEQTIMEHLDYKVNLATPNVILNFLIKKFIFKNSDFFGDLKENPYIKQNFFKIIMNVHLITLVDYEFYQFSSLAVATSILAFSRILLGLEPLPENISNFIGLTQNSIKECLKMIYENYSINFLQIVFGQLDDELNNQMTQENIEEDEKIKSNSLIQNSTLFFLSNKFQEEIITNIDSKKELI
jgi:hypothetical protein